MSRDLALSNGRLLVMFDRQYRIRDLYFPHVGKENHAEQLHPYIGEPLSASPLTWSHAEYVRTVQEYIHLHSRASLRPACGQTVRPTERRADRRMVVSPA